MFECKNVKHVYLVAVAAIVFCILLCCLDFSGVCGIAYASETISVVEESANLTSSETNNGVNLHSYINDFVSQKDIPHTATSLGGALISSGGLFGYYVDAIQI